MNNIITEKIALRGLLIALAFVLSWIESQVPYFFAIPGMKLGLTNLVVLIALYRLSAKDALFINMLRILLVSFTFGNMFSLYYSLAGGILSFVVMLTFKKLTRLSKVFISVLGGISHNIGQILVAVFVLRNTKIAYYLPWLWLSGIIAGIVIGIMCEFIIRRLPSHESQ